MFIKDDLVALRSILWLLCGVVLAEGAAIVIVIWRDLEPVTSPFSLVELLVLLVAVDRIRNALAKQAAQIAALREAIERRA